MRRAETYLLSDRAALREFYQVNVNVCLFLSLAPFLAFVPSL